MSLIPANYQLKENLNLSRISLRNKDFGLSLQRLEKPPELVNEPV